MKTTLKKIDKALEELQNDMLVKTKLQNDRRIVSTVFKVFRDDLRRMEKTGWIHKEPEPES